MHQTIGLKESDGLLSVTLKTMMLYLTVASFLSSHYQAAKKSREIYLAVQELQQSALVRYFAITVN